MEKLKTPNREVPLDISMRFILRWRPNMCLNGTGYPDWAFGPHCWWSVDAYFATIISPERKASRYFCNVLLFRETFSIIRCLNYLTCFREDISTIRSFPPAVPVNLTRFKRFSPMCRRNPERLRASSSAFRSSRKVLELMISQSLIVLKHLYKFETLKQAQFISAFKSRALVYNG